MNTKKNVLVVGGGTAACVAAAAALDAGKDVTMIFRNGGMSEISAGAIDILGVVPGEKPAICENYRDGIDELLKAYPEHAYGKCRDELDNGVNALMSLAAEGGFPMTGFDGKNVWVPNMLGTFSINACVPFVMSESVVVPGKEERVLVVGIKGNVAFNAKAAAMSYQQYQKKIGGKADYFSTEIQLTGWGDRRKISDGELADYLDTREGAQELADAIRTFCMNNRYHFDKILFPPVLGYVSSSEILALLKEACGCKVGEVEGLGNSVTAYRFTRALYKGLEKKGAVLKRGAYVDEIAPAEDGVQVTYTEGLADQLHPGVKETVTVPAAVLATGGFVGGGIKAHHTEVWIELLNEHLGKVTTDMLDRNAVNPSGQKFMNMGVEVNSDMSVKNENYAGNVFACGDLLAGQNFANERSGAGIAAATAYLAGRNAAAKV